MAVLENSPEVKGEQHFKLRAECLQDVIGLIQRMPENAWAVKIEQWDSLPDVEFEFKTRLNQTEIIGLLNQQDDSHVMIDTLKSIDEYTGKR
jgi:hypothetical protein